MKKLFRALVLLASFTPGWAEYTVRISDLGYAPHPPNPVIVYGHVTSEAPLVLSDGRGAVTVTGITGKPGDFLIVEGDYADGVLAASQAHCKATLYAGPCRTEMVYVPAGVFLMGNNGSEPYSAASELPQHEVTLSGYWIGKYEVTRGEYRAFMQAGGYSNPAYWSSAGWTWKEGRGRTEPDSWAPQQDWGSGPFTQTEVHPVVAVSYYEAEAYCAWAGGQLPTEAQWEKAGRWTGSSPNVYPWGNVYDAEKYNNTNDTLYPGYQTAPVGCYPAGMSPYGCHDVAGNVAEWCLDWFSSSYYSVSPTQDPQGPATGMYRAIRGCGWNGTDYCARISARSSNRPENYWTESFGFRFAR